MKKFPLILGLFFAAWAAADTPPPGTVKAKTYTGDGNTAITATGSSLNVNVSNSSALTTVTQGTAGTDPWFVSVRNNAPLPVNACQETGGHLASIDSELAGLLTVAVSSPLPAGTNTIGKVDVNGTIPISGSLTANQGTPGPTASPWPVSQQGTVTITGAVSVSSLPTVDQGLPGPAASPWPVEIENFPATQPISGTVTADAGTGTFTVDGSGHTQPVSGTFWQATQPVSGTFWQTTQPVSAAALPLPSGAATSVKQPDFGTAGTPSADVLSVQGHSGMTALLVDGSGSTQPVSGTVIANIGTSGSLALDASVTGLQVSQGSTTSGQKGSLFLGAVTTAAPSYTTAQSSPFSLNVSGGLRVDGSAVTQPVSGTFWQATQPVSLTTLPALVAGSALIGKVGIDQTTPGTTNGVQVNAALPAGSNVIGKVSIDQTTPGTTNLVALAANQSVNTAQINGVTPLMGNGTTGTGSQRVTIASDNTAFTVNAAPKTPSALTVKQAAITVGTSAVRLTNDGSAPPSTRVLLVAQLLSTSTANCFFGSSGVTTSSTTRGVQMFAGQTFSWSMDAGDYYAICDASTQTILVTEQE